MNEYEKWLKDYGKECKLTLKADKSFPIAVDEEQAILIMKPNNAPEDFYCDGEISPEEAMSDWKTELSNVGFNPTYVKIIAKYVFG